MGNITLIPVWIIQDILVLIIATLMIFYIIDNEERPKIVLMQFVCFVFFYASAFENVAVFMGAMGKEGFYSYGHSILMIASILSLICLVSPISNFFNFMGPFFTRTSNMQWVMLISLSVISVGILVLAFVKFWDRRFVSSLNYKKDFPIMFTFLGFPLINTLFCVIGGYMEILWLVVLAELLLLLGWGEIYILNKKYFNNQP